MILVFANNISQVRDPETIFQCHLADKLDIDTKFHIYIVQLALSKANASRDILQLLGNTHHYLHTLGNVELVIYSNV
jgi:hypothetical protein